MVLVLKNGPQVFGGQEYGVMIVKGRLETRVFIHSGGVVNLLRLKPIPGRDDEYTGNVYLVTDDTPYEMIPSHAEIVAHFEWNSGNLQLTYRRVTRLSMRKSDDEVKLVGAAVEGKSMFQMTLLS